METRIVPLESPRPSSRVVRSARPGILGRCAFAPAAVVLATSFLFAEACVNEQPLVGCFRELTVKFNPTDTSIVIGQRFTATVRLSTCNGTQMLTDTITWRADNSSVASVDSTSGQVLGSAPGQTLIFASGQRYHELGSLSVVVGATAP
jgi:hypothetical protein